MNDNLVRSGGLTPRFFTPPNRIKAKIGGQLPDAAAIARAEAAVEKLVDDYLLWIQADILRFDEALETAREDASRRKDSVETMLSLAHDVKGQGATFNYPLVSRVAQSLCVYLERHAANADLRVIRAHVESLRTIVAGKVTGEGGEIGRQIAASLEQLSVGRGG
jgi:hypothetical protein